MLLEKIVFWASALLLAYATLGYPLLLWAWAALRPRPIRTSRWTPKVSVVVVAHREADRISGRLENLLAQDYPRERFEILVAVDGTSDATAEKARAFVPAGVKVLAHPRRRGKPAMLNDALGQASGQVVVLTDARQRFAPGALRALAGPLADPRVGAVSGALILTEDSQQGPVACGVGGYWSYEKLVRGWESRVDSCVGATGAIYAIRHELYEPMPADRILDDVWLPMRIVRRGYRVLFEPAARAYDRAASSASEELLRKTRTLAGNFQIFARERWLLHPFQNRLWLQTLSHKVLRLLTPALLAGALGASLALVSEPFYLAASAVQLGFYLLALAGLVLRADRKRFHWLSVPCVFCLLVWATLVAFARFVTGRQSVTWDRASV